MFVCCIANSGGNRGLKIFLIVGIVGAALVVCIIVGVVLGVLLTANTGPHRTPCGDLANKVVDALPHGFDNWSRGRCVYGYYFDGECMYSSYFLANSTSTPWCYGKAFGADLIDGRCYYSDQSTCHCSLAFSKDENMCYDFAVKSDLTPCSHGLKTGNVCLYDEREQQSGTGCGDDWDQLGDGYCYMRQKKICDKLKYTRRQCLKATHVANKYT